jgi:hypothetical protein
VDVDSYPVTMGDDAAIARRLEALAERAAIDDSSVMAADPGLAASLAGLRFELNGLRTDLESMRAEMSDQLGRSAPAAVAEPGVIDTADDAVEERLAAIEDTLDGLAERFEALARDSAMDAGERLGLLDDRIAALAVSLQADRSAAAEQRELDGASMRDQSAALDDWAEAVRGGLLDLGQAVTTSLGSLSASVTAVPSREVERQHLDALVAELTVTVQAASTAVRDQVGAFQAPLDTRLADLHGVVVDGFGAARTLLAEEFNGTIERLEHANEATRAAIDSELGELRSDLADALDEMRERVASSVHAAHEAMAASLQEHQATSADLRDGITVAAQTSQDTGELVTGLQQSVARLDGTLSELQRDWRPRVDAVVAEGRAAAQSVLEAARAEVGEALAEVRVALADMTTSQAAQVKTIRTVTGTLDGGTERLIGAGAALLGYLGQRDRRLERERAQMLREVLEEFAEGMSTKERRAISGRLGEALDRRRDARDAGRFRRTQTGETAVEIPTVPPEIAALTESAVPASPAKRAAAATTGATPAGTATAASKQTATRATSASGAESLAPAKKAATTRKTTSSHKAAETKTAPVKKTAKATPARRVSTKQAAAKPLAQSNNGAKRTTESPTPAP